MGIFLSSCATAPLGSLAGKYKTVAVRRDVKAADHYFYRDVTGERARGMGASMGLAGELIGGMIGASSESAGFERFDATAGQEKIDIKNLVYRHFVETLQSSHLFQISPANAEADFHLQIIGYGVGPVSGHQLGGIIYGKATLMGRNGQSIWQRTEMATSSTTASLQEYETNHQLWPRVIDEAAEKLARQLILYANSGRR